MPVLKRFVPLLGEKVNLRSTVLELHTKYKINYSQRIPDMALKGAELNEETDVGPPSPRQYTVVDRSHTVGDKT